jgi:ferritin-like metal-binding protein YciE
MLQDKITISTLHHLLDYEAGKFISAEHQLSRELLLWINTASSIKLKTVLQRYMQDIEIHLQQMDEFIQQEKLLSVRLNSRLMKAYIDDTNETLLNCSDAEVKDACLLASVQLINHYKISAYGTAAAFANALDMEKAAQFFHQAEVNEKQIDDRLSQLALYEINTRAKAPISLP